MSLGRGRHVPEVRGEAVLRGGPAVVGADDQVSVRLEGVEVIDGRSHSVSCIPGDADVDADPAAYDVMRAADDLFPFLRGDRWTLARCAEHDHAGDASVEVVVEHPLERRQVELPF